MRRLAWSLTVIVFASACRGDQKAAMEQKVAAEPAAPVTVDTAKSSPPPDTAARRKKAAPDDRLRDSAFAPKFEVDDTGKVRRIKKP